MNRQVPQGMSICINHEEETYAFNNKEKIERQRDKIINNELQYCLSESDQETNVKKGSVANTRSAKKGEKRK